MPLQMDVPRLTRESRRFWAESLGSRVQDLGFRVEGSGYRAQGVGNVLYEGAGVLPFDGVADKGDAARRLRLVPLTLRGLSVCSDSLQYKQVRPKGRTKFYTRIQKILG